MQKSLALTYVGHATIAIEMGGATLITDPLLRKRVWHLGRQKDNYDYKVLQEVDAVLISHAHWDHLDIPSLKELGKHNRIIGPQGLSKLLSKHGFDNVEEIQIGGQSKLGLLEIEATYAKHNGSRYRFGPPMDALGFIIKGPKKIYYAGDTELFPEMLYLAESLDIALLPVWGWGPTLGSGHMNPRQAAQSLEMLSPEIAIPIHWGTYFPIGLKWLMPKLLSDPPLAFSTFARTLAPQVKIRIMSPGENIRL
jgi:L-ascorbate metabolism protein UlaG (beta-lactamase superfamily)